MGRRFLAGALFVAVLLITWAYLYRFQPLECSDQTCLAYDRWTHRTVYIDDSGVLR
jgi:hypothetical protein